MHPSAKQKKFTHNRMKACLQRNEHEDKQNINLPEDFRNKKLSVELPLNSNHNSSNNQKSILNEQISVTLNTFNLKHLADKDLIGFDINALTQTLSKRKQQMPKLKQILQNTEVKSIQMKFLLQRLLSHIKQDNRNQRCSIFSQRDEFYSDADFSECQMMPYIERQIDVLQKNYVKLLQQKDKYASITKIANDQKQKMLSSLKQIHQRQLYELNHCL